MSKSKAVTARMEEGSHFFFLSPAHGWVWILMENQDAGVKIGTFILDVNNQAAAGGKGYLGNNPERPLRG